MEKQKFTEIEKMAEIVKGYCDVCPVKDKEQETCLLCKMEHLYNHGLRLQKTTYMLTTDGTLEMIETVESERQATAKEIIDLANELDCYYYDEENNCCGALSDYSKMPCGLVPCTDDKCGMKEPRQSFECTAKNCPLEFGKAKKCTVHCCEYRTKPTNFDKITSSVDVLLDFLDKHTDFCTVDRCKECHDFNTMGCKECIKEWLEQESKEWNI